MTDEALCEFELRILRCLHGTHRKHTLGELTKQYNRHYPPHRIGNLTTFPASEQQIHEVLHSLIEKQFVLAEISTIHGEYFCITVKGTYRLKSKK